MFECCRHERFWNKPSYGFHRAFHFPVSFKTHNCKMTKAKEFTALCGRLIKIQFFCYTKRIFFSIFPDIIL